jgi:hypothetical protein
MVSEWEVGLGVVVRMVSLRFWQKLRDLQVQIEIETKFEKAGWVSVLGGPALRGASDGDRFCSSLRFPERP